jgi:hypothetical protein
MSELNLSPMDRAGQGALAQQLEGAAAALSQTDPNLADRLNAAAEHLRTGDTQAAQRDLQAAARELTEAGGRIEGSALAGRAAAEVSGARQRLLESAGGNGQQTASAGGSSQGDGQAGSTAGQGAENGQQPAASGQDGAGGGAGRGEGAGETGTGGPTGASSIDQGNAPGDGGIQPYEPISPTQRFGGTGGEVLTLPPGEGSGDQVTGEGDLPFDQPGSSQVPYTDVYPQYAEAYRQAIESGQVPAYLRPVVRDYFSSLEPPEEP